MQINNVVLRHNGLRSHLKSRLVSGFCGAPTLRADAVFEFKVCVGLTGGNTQKAHYILSKIRTRQLCYPSRLEAGTQQ